MESCWDSWRERPARQSTSLQAIQRAFHPTAALAQDVRVDHGGGHVIVAQQLLDGPDVRLSLEDERRTSNSFHLTTALGTHRFLT